MAPPTPDDIALLAMTIRGQLVLPGDLKYEAQVKKEHNAGLWNVQPAMFICCRDSGDVSIAIQFATKHNLPISVRSRGHSPDGTSLREGSIVIDVEGIQHFSYDERTEIVTIGPGNCLSDVNVGLMRVNRMTPIGVAPPTGCGGLILHGGVGWLTHKYGLSVDNIVGLEIVLADGSVHRLSHKSQGEDKELYFAARGAAGTVGIVTEIQMRTYPQEMMTGGMWAMIDDDNYTKTRILAKLARKLSMEQEAKGDRKLFGGVYTANMPPLPHIPENLHHEPVSLVVMGAWGDDEAAMTMMKQFVDDDRDIVLGKPPAPMPFNIFNQILAPQFLNFPPFATYWAGSLMNDELTNDGIDAFTDLWVGHEPWLNGSFVGFEFGGGKQGAKHGATINQGNDHCKAGLRNYTCASVPLLYFPNEPGFLETAKSKAKSLQASLKPFAAKIQYVNYVSEHQEEKKEQPYDVEDSLKRWITVKQKVDPENIFRRHGLDIKESN